MQFSIPRSGLPWVPFTTVWIHPGRSNPWLKRLPCLGPNSQSVLRSYSDKHHRNERSGLAYDQEERDGQNQDAGPQFLLELALLSLTWQNCPSPNPPTIFSDEF